MAKITEVPIEVFSNLTDLPTSQQRVGVADNVLKLINGPSSFLVGTVPTAGDLPIASAGSYLLMAGGALYSSDGTTVSQGIVIPTITSAALTALRAGYIASPGTAPPIGTSYRLSDSIFQGKVVSWMGDAFQSVNGGPLHANFWYETTRTSDGTANDQTLALLATIVLPGWAISKVARMQFWSDWYFDGTSIGKLFHHTFNTTDLGGGTNANSSTIVDKRFYEVRMSNSYTVGNAFNISAPNGSSANAMLAVTTGINVLADTNFNIKTSWQSTVSAGLKITLRSATVVIYS